MFKWREICKGLGHFCTKKFYTWNQLFQSDSVAVPPLPINECQRYASPSPLPAETKDINLSDTEEVEVSLRLKVNKSARLGIEPFPGAHDQITTYNL
jgi:hypothetical protein